VKISREDVLRVADLAYLDLSELDTSKVEPMAQVLADDQTADATLREDLVVPCAVADDVLAQAPDPEPPYFRVPKVIER
jgi:aspartyl/glutamyl-tRNA(Asn/Gln) amidotransferase C subunit